MRISPFVFLSALAAVACGEVPDLTGTDGASETETGTSTGTGTDTDTSTTATPTTTGSGQLCVPGSSAACTCPTGNMGSQDCNPDGKSYGMCECEGGGSDSNGEGTLEPTASTTEAATTTEGTTTEGDTDATTTTGGPTCDDPGPEPNNSEANAIDLGEQGCGAMAQTVEGVLDGDGDADWFSYYGVWNALCVIGPNTAHTLTASDDVRLCVFADCDQGTANINCPNGTSEVASPGGHPGCCGDGDVDFNLDCTLLNDNARVFIRLDQAPADACVEYSVAYNYDE